jgi:hypothetical protein
MQVVDELRRGVRLKKINFHHSPTEYELTPYEILMEDIRSRKYNLRKVMVNGDIPPKVKQDAHAVILEFIRSRPPLRKVSHFFFTLMHLESFYFLFGVCSTTKQFHYSCVCVFY